MPQPSEVIEVVKREIGSSTPTESSLSSLSTPTSTPTTTPASTPTSTPPPLKRTKVSLFEKIRARTEKLLVEEDEVEEYLKMGPGLMGAVDPLDYWKKNRARFPRLCSLVHKYLAFPATSGSVERLFSVAGSICRSRRARLLPETTEKILSYRQFIRNKLIKNDLPVIPEVDEEQTENQQNSSQKSQQSNQSSQDNC